MAGMKLLTLVGHLPSATDAVKWLLLMAAILSLIIGAIVYLVFFYKDDEQ